jgi:hypothetical protein
LILGAGEFPQLLPGQEPSEAFRNSAHGIAQYFRSQAEVPIAYRVESLFDSSLNVIAQAEEIESLLKKNSDTTDLIIYYVGHGGFVGGREYYLALRGTQRKLDHLTCLRMSSLSAIINRAFSDRRLFIILDCCFAGTAVNEWQSISSLGRAIEARTFEGLPAHGTALLVAASKDDPAITPHGRPYTMFCECLLEVLNKGIAGAGPTMSLDEVANRLRSLVDTRFGEYGSVPEIHSPRQRSGDIARWPLFPNPAYAAPSLPTEVVSALKNPLPKVRAGAIDTVEDYARADADGLGQMALVELERIANSDDSSFVKSHAREALARLSAVSTLPGRDYSLGGAAEHLDETCQASAASTNGAESSSRNPVPSDDAPLANQLAASNDDRDNTHSRLPSRASLTVWIRPTQRRLPQNGEISWKCKVSNTGTTALQSIEVTDDAGNQLCLPFSLNVAQVHKFSFMTRYSHQGGQINVAALGRTDQDGLVSAEASAHVSIQRTASRTTLVSRARNPATLPTCPAHPVPISASGRPRMRIASFSSNGSKNSAHTDLDLPRFREVLRRVKATAPLGDNAVNRAIQLIGEGERHFRVAAGQLAPQPGWHRAVVDWVSDVSTFETDELVMLKLSPPTQQEIVQNLDRLASHLHSWTGVRIPTYEFEL